MPLIININFISIFNKVFWMRVSWMMMMMMMVMVERRQKAIANYVSLLD